MAGLKETSYNWMRDRHYIKMPDSPFSFSSMLVSRRPGLAVKSDNLSPISGTRAKEKGESINVTEPSSGLHTCAVACVRLQGWAVTCEHPVFLTALFCAACY